MSKKQDSPHSPNSELFIPQTRREVNAWNRHYHNTNPLIATWIDEIVNQVYSEFHLVKKANMSEKDFLKIKKVFFTGKYKFVFERESCNIIEELNLMGESFPYIQIDEEEGKIDQIIVQNNDYIEVRHKVLSDNIDISLVPDEELKKLIVSNEVEDKKLVKTLEPDLINMVKEGKNIPLHPMYISHIAIKKHPYDVRGSSRLIKLFKSLMAEDIRREKLIEENKPLTGLDIVKEEIKRECRTKAFKKSLEYQRSLLERWILERLIKMYQKMHGIKGNLSIKWREKIQPKEIEKLF